MKQSCIKRFAFKLALVAVLGLPELAGAQVFNYNSIGDVLAGFRKTGANATGYEVVVDFGNLTNFLFLAGGTTINLTNYSQSQLTDAFTTDNNLQWSVFASTPSSWTAGTWNYPNGTIWCTLPAPGLTTQSTAPVRESNLTSVKGAMQSVGANAASISGFIGTSNADNTPFLVRESTSLYGAEDLTAVIGDINNTADGDFGSGGTPLAFSVENTTPGSFTAAQRSDFYQMVPASGGRNVLYGSDHRAD